MSHLSPVPSHLHTPADLGLYDWFSLYQRMLETTDPKMLAAVADDLEAAIFKRTLDIDRTRDYVEFQEMRLAIEVLRIVREEKLGYPKINLNVRKPPARADF